MKNEELKIRIENILRYHRGRANPVKGRELRTMLHYNNERRVRLMIAELRADGMPILFATSKPAGYYIPSTRQELLAGLDVFRSYIIDLCVQRARIKKAGMLHTLLAHQDRLL